MAIASQQATELRFLERLADETNKEIKRIDGELGPLRRYELIVIRLRLVAACVTLVLAVVGVVLVILGYAAVGVVSAAIAVLPGAGTVGLSRNADSLAKRVASLQSARDKNVAGVRSIDALRSISDPRLRADEIAKVARQFADTAK